MERDGGAGRGEGGKEGEGKQGANGGPRRRRHELAGRGRRVQLDVVAGRSGMCFAHSFVSVCHKPGPNVRSQSWNK
jgi:hypothetical protein